MKIKLAAGVMLIALLLLGGFLAGAWSPVAAAGTTYFVSDAGDDNNDGKSAETPWKSLAKVNAAALEPGDSVSFRWGDVWTGGLFVNQNGNAKSALTINSYGS